MSHTRYDLSNHNLRAEALTKFFDVRGIRSHFTKILSREDWIELECAQTHADILSPELQELCRQINQTCGTQLPVQVISLQSILSDVITRATTDNVFNQTACNSLLGTSCFDFHDLKFDGITGQLTINIPSTAIAQIFTSLKHELLHTSDTQLGILLYPYISAQPDAIFLIDMGKKNPPKLLLSQQFFPKEQLILHEEPQMDGSIKITPYMRIVTPTVPPDYHFMLDISTSMIGTSLQTAKKSLLHFAQILFQFAPNARLFINYFNMASHWLGSRPFLINDLQNGTLKREIDTIIAEGGTNIANASRQKIRECLLNQNQNNILLFTDGEDIKMDHGALIQDLNALTPEQKTRNKFFIISFAQQPEALLRLTQTFDSAFFIASTTELEKVLAEHGELQNWAASRDLFTTRVHIQHNLNEAPSDVSYTSVMMQSNQVEALPSFVAQPGDNIKIEVFDSFNQVLVSTQKIISSPQTHTPLSDRPRSPAQNSVFHHDAKELPGQQINHNSVSVHSNMNTFN